MPLMLIHVSDGETTEKAVAATSIQWRQQPFLLFFNGESGRAKKPLIMGYDDQRAWIITEQLSNRASA
ncbi:hypothetical protein [Bifidobacterium tissieri]|uniref:hypothetical protein n=1 Tax=Bifidobacterium tissieri TaxID=1630162 RepID=UPI0011788C0B|nr:hypothetical protein [Bifidobacterium tissieri]